MKYKVYYLKDPISNEIRYIGVTGKRLENRLDGHFRKIHRKDRRGLTHKSAWISSLVRRGYKPSIHLLQEMPTEDDVMAAEMYWIEYFKGVGCDLTNSCAGGYGNLNPTKMTRDKMRANLGKYNGSNSKPVIDDRGVVYPSAAEAGRQLNINPKEISSVIRGKARHARGRVFSYYREKITKIPTLRPLKRKWNARKIIDEDGNIFNTVSEATRYYGFKSHKSISNVLTGVTKRAGGKKFYYYSKDD